VDTAEVYGSGRSERLLGQFLKETDQPVLVATKYFPFPWRFTKKSVIRALKGSLERIKVEPSTCTRSTSLTLCFPWIP
jgi:aryl-alcohol dehydrogenase-like predicted oxidoreductase